MSAILHSLLPSFRLAASPTHSLNGFSLLEFVLVICLIGILLAVALTRLLPYIDEAERVAVLTLEGQIRNSLVTAAAQKIARGESASISMMNRSNPMELMLEVPGNYVGELGANGRTRVAPGHWFFDKKVRRLVYRPRQGFSFRADEDSVEQLEFEVRVAFADRDRDGVFNPSGDELYGVRLMRTAGSEWFDEGKAYP